MADLKLAVRLSLEGKDAFRSGLKEAQGAVGEFAGGVRGRGPGGAAGARRGRKQDPGKDLDRLGARVHHTGLAMERSARRSAAALISVAQPAIEYERAFTDAVAVTDALTDPAKEKQLRQLSTEFVGLGFSSQEVAESIGFMGMAGLSTDQIMGSMGISLKLAKASSLDAAKAIDLGTDVMTSFGIEANTTEEATRAMTRVADVMTKTFTSTNTTLPLTARALFEIGPVASQAGVEIEQAAAAVGVMASAGIKGGKAGTALRNVFLRLAKPSKEVKEGFKTIGLSIKDVNKIVETGDLAGAFKAIGDASKKLDKKFGKRADTKRRQAFAQIFGTRAAAAGSFLVEQAQTGALQRQVRETELAGGTTEAIAAKKMDSDAARVAQAQARFQQVMTSLGQKVLPQLIPVAEGLLDMAEGVAKFAQENPGMVKSLTKTIIAITATNAALGPLVTTFGGMMRGAALLQTGIGGATGLTGTMKTLTLANFKAQGAVGKLGVALGAAGLVGAAAAAGFAVGTLADQWLGLSDKLVEAATGLSKTRDEEGRKLAKKRGAVSLTKEEQARIKAAEEEATAAEERIGPLGQALGAVAPQRLAADRIREEILGQARKRDEMTGNLLAKEIGSIRQQEAGTLAMSGELAQLRGKGGGRARRRRAELSQQIEARTENAKRRREEIERFASQTPGFRSAKGVEDVLANKGIKITLDVKKQTATVEGPGGQEIKPGGGVTIPGVT